MVSKITIEEQILDLEYEMRSIGNIIDDRSMNNIPLWAYAKRYKELEVIIESLRIELEEKKVNRKVTEVFLKPKTDS